MASVIKAVQKQRTRQLGRSREHSRGRTTARDLEILRWLCRVRFATLEQLARRFSMGRSQSFHRIGHLVDEGFLLRHPQLFGIGPAILLVTPRGVAASRSKLGAPEVDARQLDHDVELVELVIDHELQGERVFTERQLRKLATRPDADKGRYALELGSGEGRRLHFPDLIVEADGCRTAIELEISEKTKRRLREILRNYGRSKLIDSVAYLCPEEVVATRVNSIARELGLSDRVEARVYEVRSR